MKKYIFTLVAVLAVAVTSVNAKQVTHRFEAYNVELTSGQSVSDEGITITCNSGIMMSPLWEASFTITTDDGKPITDVLVESYTYDYGCDGDWYWIGNYGANWTGWSTSVSGSLGLQDVYAIEVTVEEGD